MRFTGRLWLVVCMLTLPVSAQTWTVQFSDPPNRVVPYIYGSSPDKVYAPGGNIATNVSTVCCGTKKNPTTQSRFRITIYNTSGAPGFNAGGDYLWIQGVHIDPALSTLYKGTASQTASCLFPVAGILTWPDCLAQFLNLNGLPTAHPQNFAVAGVGTARYVNLMLDVGIPNHDVFTELSSPGSSQIYDTGFTWLSIFPADDCVPPVYGGIGGSQQPLPGTTKVTNLGENQWGVEVYRNIGIIEYGNAIITQTRAKKTSTTCVGYGSLYLDVTTQVAFSMTWTRQ